MRFLEVLHQHSHDHVDEHELGHQDEDDEKQRSNNGRYAAVGQALRVGITVGLFPAALALAVAGHGRLGRREHWRLADGDGPDYDRLVLVGLGNPALGRGRPERVLEDAVPVVARRYAEQGQERHAKVAEVGVLAQALAGVLVVAFFSQNEN